MARIISIKADGMVVYDYAGVDSFMLVLQLVV